MTEVTPACARPTWKYPEGRTGTSAGYQAHRTLREAACESCVAAWTLRCATYERSLSPEDQARRVQEKDETRRRWRAEQAAKAGVCAAATPDHPSGRKGTTAGYEAHIAAGENPCTPCRQTPTTPGAACARPTLRYPEGRTGTAAGYQAHKDGGEEACRPCTDAFSAKTITRRRNLPPEELERYRQGNKEASRRRRKEDPEGVRAARHRTLAKNRAAVHEAKSRPCTDCGIQYPYYVMEFDHLDADTKEFNVGAGVTCASYERLLAEIAKCELVCANCHRTRTYLRAQAKKGPRVDGQAAA